MLVLSRKTGEVITIGNDIKITVVNIDRGIVRLGIEAPQSIVVHRKEVYDKIIESNKEAASVGVDDFIKHVNLSKLSLSTEKKQNADNNDSMPHNIKI